MLFDALVPRRARRELEETLQVLRVAVLNGPRQAGKTTLAKQLVAAAGGSFVTLDDPATLQACLGDPRTFLTAYRKPLVVDEFQLGGDVLLRSVKSIVDEDLSRGQYLLTGSTRFLTVPSLSESLAGRAGIVDLWPYTQGEIERCGETGDGFLAQLLNPDVPVRQLAADSPGLSRPDLRRRLPGGPAAALASAASALVRRLHPRGDQPGRPGYQPRAARRGAAQAAGCARCDDRAAARRGAARREGGAGAADGRQDEVDVVAETTDGRVGGVEVKASATVTLADFRHLARLRDLLDASGGHFVRGIVLYSGHQVLPFGDRLVAMPLAGLWMPPG
ncbi:MAG: AAA family ATPase [Pseudonocardiaceae bacterium]